MANVKINELPSTALPSTGHVVPVQSPEGITQKFTVQQFIDLTKSQIVDGADGAYDTLKEIEDLLKADDTAFTALQSLVNQKADASSVYTQAQIDAAILASHNVTSYNYTTANNAHIVGENFAGDTSVTNTDVDLYITRIQNLALVKVRLQIEGFSQSFPNDNTFKGYFDLGSIASGLGAFDEILEGGYMTWNAEWAGYGFDSPQLAMYGSIQNSASLYPNMLYFSESDFSDWPATQTINKVGLYTNLVLVVGDV